MSYADEVLADDPAVYYRLDEASGLPQDSSGNGLHIQEVANTPAYSQAGALVTDPTNDSMRFDSASNDALRRDDDALLDVGDVFTLEAWVKRNSTGVANHSIVGKGTDSFWLFFWSDDKVHLFKDGVAEVCGSSIAITDTTTWHHIVVTKNGSERYVYIDGSDVTNLTTDRTLASNAVSLYINCSSFDVNVGDHYLDELAIYPTALDQTRVQAHYAAATVSTPITRNLALVL